MVKMQYTHISEHSEVFLDYVWLCDSHQAII